ncbi:MAG: adenosine deaminase [Proteobacteria bacterium]|nr:adenosine deaminase [Pseudomonadota bacterium]
MTENQDELERFVRGLPKAELHLHIEGSLEPEQMFEFGRRNKVDMPFANVEAVRAAYEFSNLQDFLDIYYQGAAVLRTEQDFEDLAMAYFRRLQADGGLYAEIFFDPQTHTDRGLPFSVAADGLLSGMAKAATELGIGSKLIMCFLRHLDEDSAFATLKQAEPYLDRIAGVGLDSSEVGHPPSKFARLFEAAGERGLKRVAHAGEEGPPEYVWEALDLLKVDRIDHGNRALEDPRLIERLVNEQMTLTVCPLSNLKLCVVDDLARHPIPRMLELGLRATVNSDDPAYFGGYVGDNYLALARQSGVSREDLVKLAKNSFVGSFLSDGDVIRGAHAVDLYADSFS